jgi:hypothetical protein
VEGSSREREEGPVYLQSHWLLYADDLCCQQVYQDAYEKDMAEYYAKKGITPTPPRVKKPKASSTTTSTATTADA